MAQKNKSQLVAEIDAIYVDCGTECITPEAVNTFEKDKTDSYAILNEDNDFTGTATWTKQIREHKGTDIVAGSTLTPNNVGNYFHVTGTSTTITSITTRQHGTRVSFYFVNSQTLQHSSNLHLPNGADYVTQAGEIVQFVSEGSGVWRFVTGNYQGLIPAYTTLTKSAFDALVAASALIPGNWYYVQAAYTSPLFSVDWDLLVIADTVATIQTNYVFALIGSEFVLGASDSLTLGASFTLTLQWQSSSSWLTLAQCASYTPATFFAGTLIKINDAGTIYQSLISSDGAAIVNKNVRLLDSGITGDFDPTFTTFYPYSGQYTPTVTTTGFDNATNVKSSYMVVGDILHTMHTIDVDNTSEVTFGRIFVTAPDGFTIDSNENDVIGVCILKQAKNVDTIDEWRIYNATGEIALEITGSTLLVSFQITISCQSKLA